MLYGGFNMKNEALAKRIYDILKINGKPMKVKDIADEIPDKPETTVRGRIYDNLHTLFKKVARGVYWVNDEYSGVLVVEGNGRDLSMIEDGSVHAIITDHPWHDPVSNIGGDRKFTDSYQTFSYTINDFKEKCRVLTDGGFLVEILPAENENNYDYLYSIKKMAEECGLKYYSKVAWKKGDFVSNTGRKAKNTEEIMFFSKGKARSMRPDVKKTKNTGIPYFMSGTKFMLPTMYDFQPASSKKKIHQSEKPVSLYEAILEAITEPGEIVIDQFAGSGNLGKACLNKNRFCILFEIIHENVQKIISRIGANELLLD